MSLNSAAEKVKHTPGPWEVEYDDGDCSGRFTLGMASYLIDPGMYTSIHSIELYEGVWPEDKEFGEAQANARLIAAAPEMLEALESILTLSAYMNSSGNGVQGTLAAIGRKAAAAIRKARGEK